MRALASTALLLFAGALSACSEHSAPERGPLHLASDSVDVASIGDTVRLVAMLGGTTLNANDQGLDWRSLDPATASVAFDGLVLARAEGRARIVVTRDRATDTAIVRVRQMPAEFSTAWQNDTLFVDDTLRMGLRIRDAKGNPIVPSPDELTITTTVPGVVSIDATGLITAHAAGGGSITASFRGRSVTVGITVLAPFTAVATGWAHACALTAEQSVYCWGSNWSGLLTADPRWPRPVAARLPRMSSLSATIYHSCGIDDTQAVTCWGNDSFQQVGTLDAQGYGHYGDGAPIRQVATSYQQSCALRADGTIACWGNGSGAAGMVLQGVSGVTAIAATDDHVCGLAADGSATCWRSGPVTVATPVPNGLRFTRLSAEGSIACGLVADGSAYCWIAADPASTERPAALGGSDVTIPQPVAGGLHFKDIDVSNDFVCALALDGKAWCWGLNQDYGLGTTAVARSAPAYAPVAVNVSRTFESISTGYRAACAVSAGAVYCWGGGVNESADPAAVGCATARDGYACLARPRRVSMSHP